MKDKNQIQKKENQDGNSGRRSFISKIGKGLLVVSSISLVSLTQFACKKRDDGPGSGGGY